MRISETRTAKQSCDISGRRLEIEIEPVAFNARLELDLKDNTVIETREHDLGFSKYLTGVEN